MFATCTCLPPQTCALSSLFSKCSSKVFCSPTFPCSFRRFDDFRLEELGIQREIHLVNSPSSSFSPSFSPSTLLTVAAIASAAVPAAKAASSCREPRLAVLKEAADGHPAPDAPELSGIAAPTDTTSTTGLKRVDSGHVAPRTVLLTSIPRPMHRISSELVSAGNAAAYCCLLRPPFPK